VFRGDGCLGCTGARHLSPTQREEVVYYGNG
jgi:hypothetical protein